MPTRTVTDRALNSKYFQESLDEVLGRLVRRADNESHRSYRRRSRMLRELLARFARQTAGLALIDPPEFIRGEFISDMKWPTDTDKALLAQGLVDLIIALNAELRRRFPRLLKDVMRGELDRELKLVAGYAGDCSRLVIIGCSPDEHYGY